MKVKTVNGSIYKYKGVKLMELEGSSQYLHYFVKDVEGQIPEYVFYPECKYVNDELKKSIYLRPIKNVNYFDREKLNRLLAYYGNICS